MAAASTVSADLAGFSGSLSIVRVGLVLLASLLAAGVVMSSVSFRKKAAISTLIRKNLQSGNIWGRGRLAAAGLGPSHSSDRAHATVVAPADG